MDDRELLAAVRDYIVEQALLGRRRRVLVACSGGADSTALLDILRRLGGTWRLQLGVIMVDHGLNRDFSRVAATMRRRCRRWGIPMWLERLPEGPDSETELRARRYRLLEDFARRHGYGRVATGHTRDDQVETVLQRLLRGTGITGLAGIPARRGDLFIRPLLQVSHRQLCDYLRSRRLQWWSDPANDDPRHLRNRIRHRLLPLLKREYNPAVGQALLRLNQVAASHTKLLDELAAEFELVAGLTTVYVDHERFRDAPAALQLHLLQLMAARVKPRGGRGLLLQKLQRARQRLAGRDGRVDFTIVLGGGLDCGLSSGRVFVGLAQDGPAPTFALPVSGPGQLVCEQAGWRMSFSHRRAWKPGRAGPGIVYFDARECGFPLLVRSARPGDRIHPWAGRGHRKVADLLAEAKIPRRERWRVPLLIHRERILWVGGVRRGSSCAVTDASRLVLEVSLEWFDSSAAAVIASP